MAFPSPPKKEANAWSAKIDKCGTPCHAADFLAALDSGINHLAEELWLKDARNTKYCSASLYASKDAGMPTVINILLQMNRQLLQAIIVNNLHRHFEPNSKTKFSLPNYEALKLHGNPVNQERPVIYGRPHCGPKGETMTKAQWSTTLDDMELYASIDPRKLTAGNQLSWQIDRVSPPGRDWSGGLSGKKYQEWSTKPNPRRYATNRAQREKIMIFVEKMRERLGKINDQKKNTCVFFSATYFGWTRQEVSRDKSHEKGDGAAIKSLLEAVTYFRFPKEEYFTRHVPLFPVIDWLDPSIAEHRVCMLGGGYCWNGNLDGVLAGGGNLCSSVILWLICLIAFK